MNNPEEIQLFEQVRKGDHKAFELLFHRYYSGLCHYATKMIRDNESAEEIVQDFFVKLWEKKESIIVDISIRNYLLRSVKNLCLNYIKHNKIKADYSKQILTENKSKTNKEPAFLEIDLAEKIEESINLLPEKRREIFRLSREEGLKYREIAKKLNISVKTVETQMSLAIKSLRDNLSKYKSFFTFFLMLLLKIE
jgi:RNA polymerase sigma-70 factor (ECF subfamily)